MRAFTSLAGHILGSHPQISGYYEMHISYEDAGALDRQLAAYLEVDELKPGSRYLFDKLLHNQYRLRPERLAGADLKILLALRSPEQSIASIVSLFAHRGGAEPYASAEEAARYYSERVSALAGFCRQASRGYYYFDAETLPGSPGRLLPRLADWLELDSPLSERYDIFSQTGKPRKGDSSALIRSGRIENGPRDNPVVHVPGRVLEPARETYRACRRQIVSAALDAVTLQD